MAQPASPDVVVVGAGMAGLMCAYRLAAAERPPAVLVLDAADRAGGRVLSHRHEDAWVNLGAQFLAGPGPLWDVASDLGVPHLPLRDFHPGLAARGRVVAADQTLRLLAGLPVPLRSRPALARLGVRILADYRSIARRRDKVAARTAREHLEGLNALERFAGGRHGSEDRAQVVRALVRFWLGAEPEEVAAAHAAVYLGLSLVTAGKLPPFATPVGGTQALADALAQRLRPQIVTGARVTSVRQDAGGVSVRYERGDGSVAEVRAAACVVATPAGVAARITGGLPPDVRAALEAVRYGTYVVLGVFTDGPPRPPFDRYYAVTPLHRVFQVVTSPVIAAARSRPMRSGSLLVYAGGDPARSLISGTDEEITGTFLRDLVAEWPDLDGHITHTVVHRWPAAVPYWAPRGRRGHEVLRKPLGRIRFAGDYMSYPSMQVAAMSGVTAADSLQAAGREGRGGINEIQN